MKLKFIADQAYQLDAIRSVVSLFDGLERFEKGYKLLKSSAIDDNDIVPNIPPEESLDENFLLENLQIIQEENIEKGIQLSVSNNIEFDSGLMLEGVSNDVWNYPNYTIEMETGTGKTYVYLRTIHELYKAYGFNKFIIVVPSVAIYEGVLHSIEATKKHFAELYDGERIDVFGYDSAKIGNLRTFATSPSINVMVITLAAFNSKGNNLYKSTEKLQGELLPYEYIQKTRPIIIMDEPQKMESDKSKQSFRTLKPLFALRYSATHKSSPNLIYRLTPVEAFRQNLVKKIQVIGVSEEENLNQPFLSLLAVSGGNSISAKVRAFINKEGKTVQQDVSLKQNDDLYRITNRPEHQEGYKVEEISIVPNDEFVRFENGVIIKLNDTVGSSRPAVFRWQIRNTIEQHIEIQNRLEKKGIKVLSLFFIDRVANYINNGLIRRIFDEEFDRLKGRCNLLKDSKAEDVQSSYFAAYKQKIKGSSEQLIYIEDEDATNDKQRKAQKEAFELIMKKKEELLSFNNKVGFIFAHSALQEGWDNPNVFQICTLKITVSEPKRRQEIGRGLRLSVNQDGERVEGDQVNILTVIANESYESFANNLQSDYREAGDTPPPRPTPKKKNAQRRDVIFNSSDFKEFWSKVAQNTTYKIKIDTPQLIQHCCDRLKITSFPRPIITVTKGKFVITEITFELKEIDEDYAKVNVSVSNTNNENAKYENVKIDQKFKFEKIHSCLRGYKINKYEINQTDKYVEFTNGDKLSLFKPLKIVSEEGQKPQKILREHSTDFYPVFNFIERTALETGLTKNTLTEIYRTLPDDKKNLIFTNPEGFSSKFIEVIKECLADHVAENIEFTFVEETSIHDIDKVFPAEIPFVQRETIESNEKGLYEFVQVDSDVERNFVNHRLHDDDKIVFYFKFPSIFRIKLPRIIGNYNPDWGIVRVDDSGAYKLQLVRETKGRPEEEIEKLQFSSEKRKIVCAKRHFNAIGINYRAIDDKIINWYLERSKVTSEELDL